MTAAEPVDRPAAQPPDWTPAGCVVRVAETHPQRVAIHEYLEGGSAKLTYRELSELARDASLALVAQGVRPGDRVLLHAPSSSHWVAALLAAQTVGAIPFGAYPTSSPADVCHLLNDARPSFALLGGSTELGTYLAALGRGGAPAGRVCVVDDAAADPVAGVNSWPDALASSDGSGWACTPCSRRDIASIVYTSGSTGPPKGAMLSYENLTVSRDLLAAELDFTDDDVLVSYLPMNHIAEQSATIYMGLAHGAEIYISRSTQDVLEEVARVHPTVFLAVPRILEKLKQLHEEGMSLAELGLDRVRYITSSGAPAPAELYGWMNSIDLILREGWGLTETSGCITFTGRTDPRPGTVGVPLARHSVRLTDDGEILVKGPGVFAGYWKNSSATREAVDHEGWLHTGDLGTWDRASPSADPCLRIIGRKKDLIITAGAKNVAPAGIEAALMRSPLIEHAVLVGDGRRFVSALIDINDFGVCRSLGIPPTDRVDLIDDPRVEELVQGAVDEVNADLARVAQVRRFALLPRPVGSADGELTATQKLKRGAVIRNFERLVDEIYDVDREG